MENNSNKQVYTMNEVCIVLSVSRKTLYNWEAKGAIKSFKICGSRRYNKEEIDNMCKNKEDQQ